MLISTFTKLYTRKGGEEVILQLIMQTEAPAQMSVTVGMIAFAGGVLILALVLWRFSKIE